eukprot:jgi/Tetstr1/442924/TSEL_030986.t1
MGQSSSPVADGSPREGNVQVAVRVRPAAHGGGCGSNSAIDVRGPQDLIFRPAAASPHDPAGRPFHFDHVLGPEVGQEAVFTRVGRPVVDNCLAGFNSTVFAYGQTGSGKTHTMLGECSECGANIQDAEHSARRASSQPSISPRTPKYPAQRPRPDTPTSGLYSSSESESSLSSRNSPSGIAASSPAASAIEDVPALPLSAGAGLTPRAFDYLFTRISAITAAEPGTTFAVRASFYELYNEVVTDLLSGASNLPIRQNLRSGTVFVEGTETVELFSVQDALAVVSRGLANRTVAQTQMNAESSRSHCILTCVVESKTMEDGVGRLKQATLNLVDLAGSERQARTAAMGQRLKEASSINKSLSTLGHVIMNLVQGCPHVPYRESKLTHILQDSLGGNAKAVLIAAVSPNHQDAPETDSTLGFASRARRMKNRAVVNEDTMGDATQLRKENTRLRKELEAFRALETTDIANKVVAENDRLRAELAAVKGQPPGGTEVDVEDAVAAAESSFHVWEQDAAVELLEAQLKEVLATNQLLEERVDELAASNAKLRSQQACLAMENVNLRVSSELVSEFNAAFQRATEEADQAYARVAELEAERAATVGVLTCTKTAHHDQVRDHELLLQEFSELTKMLAEAVTERDQAIADRDAALMQKLEMSRSKQHAEDQLDELIRKKTAVQVQLSNIMDSGEGCHVAPDPLNLSTPRGKENLDPVRVRPDPLLRRIITKLEGMERTRSASQPGTPTEGAPGFTRLQRECSEAQLELANLRADHNKAMHELAAYRHQTPPGPVH